MKSAVIMELPCCKNNCLFCRPTVVEQKTSAQEWKKVDASLLRQAADLKANGFDEIEVSGCDPIEYKNIVAFITLLKKKLKIRFVQLATHGRDLCNEDLAKRLGDAGLHSFV